MPKIGLLSDSHDEAHTTRLGTELLAAKGAEVLVHLGDIGGFAGTDVLDALLVAGAASSEALPVRVVFGNNDDPGELTPHARALGIHVDHPVGRLELRGKILVYQHGDNARAMSAAIREGVHYLCHGHSHVRRDERRGQTRVINPGALHRAAEYTVALLDTDADALTFYPIPRPC
jgi:uncharacterized protein